MLRLKNKLLAVLSKPTPVLFWLWAELFDQLPKVVAVVRVLQVAEFMNDNVLLGGGWRHQ